MSVSLSYSALQNATMTIKECADTSRHELLSLAIVCIVALIIYAVLLIFLTKKYSDLRRFVESDDKLVKKFREFNDDRKDL